MGRLPQTSIAMGYAVRKRRTASSTPSAAVVVIDDLAGEYTIPFDARRRPTRQEVLPMCVDNDSRPPITPIAGGSAGGQDLKLTSSDGTKFMAYAARAANPTGAGMIVIPDVRGLHIYYKELADRFAEVGVDAVAIDFFARTATSEDRSDTFDFMSEVPKTKPETLQADITAAAAYLRGKDGGQVRSLFSVGFCFGGALSYLQAASDLGYAGVIGFYGWPLGVPPLPRTPQPAHDA